MVLFPDFALARRLEFHEAWSSSEHARTQARLYPETGKELAQYKTGKGTMQIPYAQPLPEDLVRKIAAYCITDVQENDA